MNSSSKGLTTREKTLICILLLIIIGAVYFLVVHQPVSDGIESERSRTASIEDELIIVNAQAQKMAGMKTEMADLEKKGLSLSEMPSYNSSKQEIDFLHDVLSAQTLDYMVNFTKVTRMGNQIRREFSLRFTAKNYDDAEKIVDALEKSEIRCLIGDLDMGPVESEGSLFDDQVDVACVATFYETMYGGRADSDLPEDSTPVTAATESAD